MKWGLPGKPLASRKWVIKFKSVEHASLTQADWNSASGVPVLDCSSSRQDKKARTKMGSFHMPRALQSTVTQAPTEILQFDHRDVILNPKPQNPINPPSSFCFCHLADAREARSCAAHLKTQHDKSQVQRATSNKRGAKYDVRAMIHTPS